MVDTDTTESWKEAREFLEPLGSIPASFGTTIRFLLQESDSSNLSPSTRFSLGRLLKSPSVTAPFYFCAKTFRSEHLSSRSRDPLSLFAQTFDPDEMAIILSLLYLFRTQQKFCDKEQWDILTELVHVHGDIGGITGGFIPAVGFKLGVFTGALRQISMGLFLAASKKEFANYRRSLKRRSMLFDSNEEFRTFGCTHAQVASLVCQHLGLGAEIGESVRFGFADHLSDEHAQDKTAAAIFAVSQWISSLYFRGKQPDVVRGAQYFPLTRDLEILLPKVTKLSSTGSRWKWLSRNKNDISPELTPELFPHAESQAALASEPAPITESPDDLPQNLIDELSKTLEPLEEEETK